MITREQLEAFLKDGDLTGVTLMVEGRSVTIFDFDADYYYYRDENGTVYQTRAEYVGWSLAYALARQLLETMKP